MRRTSGCMPEVAANGKIFRLAAQEQQAALSVIVYSR